mmetsp:Transcript_28058/g.37301  ORF Transcript_28058/g.37301 Transcript_28058/m.37301 type:complete len:93 (-) Transcript_28058:614-892(-)
MSKMKNDMFKIKAQKEMRRASLQYLNRHLFLCQNHNLYFPKYKTRFKTNKNKQEVKRFYCEIETTHDTYSMCRVNTQKKKRYTNQSSVRIFS